MCASEETQGPHSPYLPETDLGSKVDSQESHDLADKTVKPQTGVRHGSRGLASYREFARTLIEIGLIEAVELGKIAVQSPKEVLGLTRALVKAGKLTPYQAAAVYQKKSRGLLIGDYLILDKVGQGGMGKVFKARHRKLGRLGAIKILPPSFARDRDAVRRFRREFEAAGQLKHINLVAAFEANEDRGVHFLVMEYVEGMNLDRVVSEQGPLAIPRGVDYLIQAARGLEASHGMGIIHRDIKPANLMLDRGGTVRVLDLGLARIVDANNPFAKTATGRLTQSGMYMGTIDYMAPEQAEDPHSVDHRADIYSLGCTLYFLLAGGVPFPGKTILKRLLAHQEHAAPSLRAIRPEVSPALEAAYLKMMAKRPEERPASMSDVIAILQASLVATDTEMERAAPASQHRPAPKARNEAPRERASSPPIIDSAIFARGVEGGGRLSDRELSLRDLVMDVLPEAGLTGDSCTVHDELEGVFTDQEINLRELAMELGEEAAPPATPKPRPPRP
jgi:serine/threonine protein kinase